MANLGSWTLFDAALPKIINGVGPISLPADTFKAALVTSAQALSKAFVGSSGDARYADLTAELATASGYTNGGLTLSGQSVSSSPTPHWTVNSWQWTLTGSITFKYCVLFDFTAPNEDLLAFVDMDTSNGDIIATAGPLQFVPDGSFGLFQWTQP